MNWYRKEKLRGEMTENKLKQRLSFLLQKRKAILDFNKSHPSDYIKKPVPDVSGLDSEIAQIQEQLSIRI